MEHLLDVLVLLEAIDHLEHLAGALLGKRHRGDRDVLGFRGKENVEMPAGEWNRSEIVCDGDTLKNILNGKVMNYGTGSSHTTWSTVSKGVAARKGGRPVNSSYRIAPKL